MQHNLIKITGAKFQLLTLIEDHIGFKKFCSKITKLNIFMVLTMIKIMLFHTMKLFVLYIFCFSEISVYLSF